MFGLTRNLATEALAHGIRVNALAPRAYTRMSASHADALANYMSMSKEVMDQINASMPPAMCAPAAAFLAHESCPLNGEILQIGMGSVSESRWYIRRVSRKRLSQLRISPITSTQSCTQARRGSLTQLRSRNIRRTL